MPIKKIWRILDASKTLKTVDVIAINPDASKIMNLKNPWCQSRRKSMPVKKKVDASKALDNIDFMTVTLMIIKQDN